MKNVTKKAVDELMKLVTAGSVVITDDFRSYTHLGGDGWDHWIVNHNLGEYAGGDDHINTVEGLFQDLRPRLDTFKGVYKRNLPRFVSIFQFNYNQRPNTMDMFTEFLHTMLDTLSVT